jgi:hypothetical protein
MSQAISDLAKPLNPAKHITILPREFRAFEKFLKFQSSLSHDTPNLRIQQLGKNVGNNLGNGRPPKTID